MNVKEQIKKAREISNKTSKQVADDLGVNPVTYSRYETGTRKPSLDFLEKLSNYYKLTFDYFLAKGKGDFGTEQKLSDLRDYMYKCDLLIATLLIARNEYDESDMLKKDVAEVYISHAKKLYMQIEEKQKTISKLVSLYSFDEYIERFFMQNIK